MPPQPVVAALTVLPSESFSSARPAQTSFILRLPIPATSARTVTPPHPHIPDTRPVERIENPGPTKDFIVSCTTFCPPFAIVFSSRFFVRLDSLVGAEGFEPSTLP